MALWSYGGILAFAFAFVKGIPESALADALAVDTSVTAFAAGAALASPVVSLDDAAVADGSAGAAGSVGGTAASASGTGAGAPALASCSSAGVVADVGVAVAAAGAAEAAGVSNLSGGSMLLMTIHPT